ncbi:CBS domain-containing protein [Actinosynnema mirum DSM 43827]|uniref:CBS domain-containing protein n=1 Tax=Actinosynnema mirum (strain ATCC 29888 / DSM 43827 / JCM 3225 / NBRC 14064 / NCIMB 13271 / NRRL B-12336 / IMRU 3971 / 101) TaxID=446462 RepID=C6WRF1_ACTMD|nr:CBS domain-containing protein [Actinosynnema mirum DSM 43827]AXX28583.1 Magnesium and cobalt efflux protein CorC [Actinosynnema pretiosum subsp. pretiosum]
MIAGSTGLLVLAVLLILAAGAFAGVDAALGTVSRARVEALLRQNKPGAKQLMMVLGDRPRHVNLLLLLRLGCELSATVLVTVVSFRLVPVGWAAVLTAGASMLVVSYVLVGVGPRTLGRQHPYAVSLLAAAPVRVLGRVLGPLSKLLILVGNAITPGKGFREGPFSSEVELRELVDMAQERGVVDEGEREMIHSVFELGDTIAREVMVPRTEIVWIEQAKSVRQALALSLRTGYTRVPVIGESVDDIVGVVNLKDLVRIALSEQPNGKLVSDVMRSPAFIPDTKPVADLLREMQLSRNHLAVVVDEYGGTAGLLTIEDILEEIVGEITDESDTDDRQPVEYLADGAVRVSARLPVDDLDSLFGTELDDHEVETVGGLLAQRLGRVPLPGTEAEIAGLRMRAEGGKDERGRMRITTVLVRPLARPAEDDEGSGGDE